MICGTRPWTVVWDGSTKSWRGRIANDQLIVRFKTLKSKSNNRLANSIGTFNALIRLYPEKIPHPFIQTWREDAVDV